VKIEGIDLLVKEKPFRRKGLARLHQDNNHSIRK